MDTIFALATAKGKAGVAIVRLSGPEAFAVARRLCAPLPKPRTVALRELCWAGEVLDHALVLCFAAGASFTGEDVVELHLHGSAAVIGAVTSVLGGEFGLRIAGPGEFTRRALENGVLDLTQVEGLADLIDAETEAQRKQAQRVLSGEIGKRAEIWRKSLIRAAALVEATIDFVDEDVPVDVAPEVIGLIDGLAVALAAEVGRGKGAERLRAGFEVAILGRPNSGKSTLLNALAGREAAITSEYAGTTRDVIEVRMDLSGLPVSFLDTAGIRLTEDPVERMGIDLALRRAEGADMRIFLVTEVGEAPVSEPVEGDVVVFSKADRRDDWPGLAVSGKTGIGMEGLLARIVAELELRLAGDGVVTRERHMRAMRLAIEALAAARVEVLRGQERAELAAAEIRRAIAALDVLVGRLGVEDFLEEIFASFCIGK